jgi:hypothetical protein
MMIEPKRATTESDTIESNTLLSKAADAGRRRKHNPRNAIAVLTAVLGLLTLTASARSQAIATPRPTPHPAEKSKQARHIKEAKKASKRRVIPVTISKGETYTISGLEKGAKTESKAVANPNALSVQSQPSGDIVLLGTEGGSWKIDATLASGEKVTYDVKVKAEAPPINSLEPGSAPTSIGP